VRKSRVSNYPLEDDMTGERETTLEELLREPIIHQIMASYGVHVEEIRRLFREVRVRSLPTRQNFDRRNVA
jgi:hypothetical protein